MASAPRPEPSFNAVLAAAAVGRFAIARGIAERTAFK
jgi:hypothetical protein